MAWTQTRSLLIALFLITAGIIAFGKFLPTNIQFSAILNSTISWAWIFIAGQLIMAFSLWKNYIGKQWYADRTILVVINILTALTFFGLFETFGIKVTSSLVLGIPWATFVGLAQLLFLLMIVKREI